MEYSFARAGGQGRNVLTGGPALTVSGCARSPLRLVWRACGVRGEGRETDVNKLQKAACLLRWNPALLLRILAGRLRRLAPFPGRPVRKRIRGVLFEFDFALSPFVKDMYCGVYEPLTLAAMRRFLRPGGTFLDVGASIGFLTAVGAGLVGTEGEVHSFEPAPECAARLRTLAAENPDFLIVTNECALGEAEGTASLDMAGDFNLGWNTMVPGFMPKECRTRSLDVRVRRLDRYIAEHGLANVSLIKIDTEGYELLVLRGLEEFLKSVERLPVIICEIAPSGYALLGGTLEELSRYMKTHGYVALSLLSPEREVDVAGLTARSDVLFVPKR